MNLAYLEQEHRITAAEADVASLLRPGTIFTLMQEIAGEHSVALGCGSHAFGTVRALEMGEVEGAMASLSLVITALLTVVVAPFLGNLL